MSDVEPPEAVPSEPASDEAIVEAAVNGAFAVEDARCEKAGFMQFVGERETVFDCTFGSSVGCFVYVDELLTDVTADLISLEGGESFRRIAALFEPTTSTGI